MDGWGLDLLGQNCPRAVRRQQRVMCVRTVLLTGVYCAEGFAKNSNKNGSGAREDSEMVRATVCNSMCELGRIHTIVRRPRSDWDPGVQYNRTFPGYSLFVRSGWCIHNTDSLVYKCCLLD